ncbi:MAG: rod shape-determining protein [Fimbriimonadaceae bacterium]|nr:rod shape-determining protein [Fimbriimonadaceae bacterium]QYK56750.1 MAG: rod shape-determining protein [Fimbriimonadaceae bacterium]
MGSNGHGGGFWRTFQKRFTSEIGIDLGTANTLVHVAGRGILIREPSVVARNKDTGEILQVGEEARRMLGRTPANIVATRPLRDGVIADYDMTRAMIAKFIKMTRTGVTLFQTVVVGIPSGVTEVERDAVLEAAKSAGAQRAYVIEEPMAAAIGAGMPIVEPIGSMIVDIGGGTTEVAVISLAGIVHSRSIRVAGDEIDEAISAYVRRAYNLFIGDRTAEQAKIEIGCAYPMEEDLEMTVKGRDLVTGLPRSAVIRSDEVRVAIQEPLTAIVEAVKLTLEATPPELAADCMNQGIVLAGGGALLRGMDRLIQRETGIPVHIAADPLSCVAIGTGHMLEVLHEEPAIRRMLEKASRS